MYSTLLNLILFIVSKYGFLLFKPLLYGFFNHKRIVENYTFVVKKLDNILEKICS